MVFGIGTSKARGRRHRRRTGRLLVQSLALALVVPVGVAQAAEAAGGPSALGRPDVPESRVSKVKEFDGPGAREAREQVAREQKANAGQARRARSERKAAWPKPGSATVALAGAKAGKAALAGVPVTMAPAKAGTAAAGGSARVTVLDQKAADKAGITGVLLTAEAATPGAAEVSVDYSSFASAIGGGWSQRLHLVRLPACVLTTPQKPECRTQTPLNSQNDIERQSVSAQVSLAESASGASPQLLRAADSGSSTATVLAVTATSSGSGESPKGAGDFSATPLSESSAWQSGGSSGSFTWSYGFTMPPAAAGPAPSLSLSYDSGSVDGRTATTNNQGTTVGEGFALTESYIERAYGSCDDDGHTDVFDQCWKYDNARLVLNGKSTRLVKDKNSGAWRLEDDDASKVTRSTGADNEDDNGEYWTVTTGDGTKYVFGKNKLDGADTQRTNSVWTVPVFGDDSGEPGYSAGSTFADRALTQAWRWNLDYVEDTRGNAATYWYTKKTNYYKKNKATTANAAYTRGGFLNRVEYGLRAGVLFTDKADAKVTFRYADRCTASDCSGGPTKETAEDWPDVPYDAICASGDTECYAAGPSFFILKRLTGIDTFSYKATTATYDPVDSWELTQEYLDGGDIGDSSDQVLTLKSLKRTGKAGDTAIGLNPISFTYQLRPNRVDATDDILPLTRPRISTVTSETGAITRVTLSGEECVRSEVLDAAPDTNTRSCYPQFWNINGAENASIDWFHKYRVLSVGVFDPAANNEAVQHAYEYSGAAWHYNDDPFAPADERTWSDWRGYRQVTAWTGATGRTRSKTVSLYMQGMHGDKKTDGTTKSVSVAPLSVPGLTVASITDSAPYAGQLREQVTYNGTTALAATANDPWSQETARQSPPGAGDHVARYVRTQKTYGYTYLTASNTWRSRQSATTFDAYGMPTTVEDLGDADKNGDETCTRTWYARNTDVGLISLVSRIRTVARTCATADASLNLPATYATRGDVLADSATVYDTPGASSWSATQKPTKGQPTWTGRATGYAVTAGLGGERLPTGWQTTATTTYDTLGRPVSVTNADGGTSTTAYVPADAGPLTRTTVTAPPVGSATTGHRTITYLDPRRSLALRTYDPNNNKTETTYDALGRITAVWQANRVRGGGDAASVTFDYHLGSPEPSWVSTSTLKRDGKTYNTSYTLYDALLRPLQTQSPTPEGGRLLTDTRYDTRGLAYQTYADIFDTTSTPNGTYARAEYGGAPKQSETVFDGAGRATQSTLYVYGVKKWSTTTSYTGDSVATTALEGGSAQRTITDVRGRTTETRAYASTTPADAAYGTGPGASYTSTKFKYTPDGKPKTINGPDGATWSYVYDLFGRQTSMSDPDKGNTTLQYDVLDRVTKTTDARGASVLSAYDELSRVTGTWSGSMTDANQLTGYTYDTVFKGLPTSSTRYVGGRTGDAYTQTVTAYDKLNRPTASKLELPGSEAFVKAGAPSALTYTSYYNLDGTLQYSSEPAMGGLSSEIISFAYDGLGDLTAITGSTGYLRAVAYSALAQPLQLTLGTGGSENKNFYVTNRYEEGTDRLTRSNVTDQTHPYMLQDLNYTYDQTGNVTAISDPTTLGGGSSPDTQCFAYDGHQRLTEAWTPTSQGCADTRSASALSGPAPYWNSYTYNTAGQRTSETVHKSDGDTKTTYCYTKPAQPHTLTGTTTGTDCTTPQRSYSYDAIGNTIKRPGPAAGQDLLWSDEGQLSKVTENGKSTDYVYDATGALLIRATENGERILYAGATELHLRADGTTWAQRYYAAGGVTAAVRSNESGTEKLTYLSGDHHGTSSLALTPDTNQTFTKRYTTPFGADRGKPLYGPWPDDKGFLGKTRDTTTGLTHIGAREYDPSIGQFISVDPILDLGAPQSLNGYSYAGNNPITFSDPTGLCFADICGIGYPIGGTGSNGSEKRFVETAPAGAGGVGTPSVSGAGFEGDLPDAANGDANNLVMINGEWNVQIYPAVYLPADHPYLDEVAKNFKERVNYVCDPDLGYDYYCMAPRDDGTDPEAYHRVVTEMYSCKKEWHCGASFFSPVDLVHAGVESGLVGGNGRLGGIGRKGGARGKGVACSFDPDTPVLLADGESKPIVDVGIGDRVESGDPESGEHRGPREVIATLVHNDDDLVDLTVRTADGDSSTIHTTSRHPFWDDTLHTWMAAAELQPGHMLNTAADAHVQVINVRDRTGSADMYNLTVKDLHTYYVLAGETPVLVHNSGAGPDPTSFSNLIPADTPEWFKPIAPGTVLSRSGNYAYVVTGDGELVIGKRTAGHVSLAQGRDVLAAGEFKTKGGQVVYLDNKSGHYQPYGAHAQKAAVDAFNKNGLGADGKYIEAWRPSC
ncbi:RHS repeat-associated core domain-containing protein [Streptomyces sp. bgisy153]|uniref:RHS repeat-associated core domain-containing protein n=1 Tax=Streptomyces sp. bgisy153 TaxID=3413793 RepID=UPI003D74CE1B